jgi:hypothetical protein
MTSGKRVIWAWVAAMAGLFLVAEVFLTEMSIIKIVICALALAVAGYAAFKLIGDGKTMHPMKPHGKPRKPSIP